MSVGKLRRVVVAPHVLLSWRRVTRDASCVWGGGGGGGSSISIGTIKAAGSHGI